VGLFRDTTNLTTHLHIHHPEAYALVKPLLAVKPAKRARHDSGGFRLLDDETVDDIDMDAQRESGGR